MNPTDTRHRVADALALALLDRGVETIAVHDYGLSVLTPLDPSSHWHPIWITSVVVRWRYGTETSDVESHPHDGAVTEIAGRIIATMPTADARTRL